MRLIHVTLRIPFANSLSRRDGSPFMNLLQCAPLCDSHGRVKYFIGAQIDVSGLAMEGASMESLMELQTKYRDPEEGSIVEPPPPEEKDEFQELNELFSPRELSSVQDHGGHLFQPIKSMGSPQTPRSWLERGNSLDSETEAIRLRDMKSPFFRMSLAGVYENVRYNSASIVQSLTRAVPPRSTIPFPPDLIYLPRPPDPRHAPIALPLPNR